MINNDDSFNHNNSANDQFVVSYELLALLRWLIENDAEKIKKIITKSFSMGLKQEINQLQNQQNMSIDDIHFTIIEFLGLLDAMLNDLMHEQMVQRAIEKKLIPTIEHIDSTICDDDIVRSSVEKATSKSEQFPHENPQTMLYQELLKRWKPNKKMTVN